jgi:hypothetical protein
MCIHMFVFTNVILRKLYFSCEDYERDWSVF